MAKIWVVAKSRGQRPDFKWVDENSPAFQVTDKQFSETWMKKVSAKEAEALDEKLAAAEAASASKEQSEILHLKEQLAEARSEASAAKKEAAKATADLEKSAEDLQKANKQIADLQAADAKSKPAAKPSGKAPEDKPGGLAEQAKD